MPRARDLEQRAFDWYDARGAWGRIAYAGLAGVVTAAVTANLSWATRIVAGWDAVAGTLLGCSWWIIGTADARETRRRAAAEDPGRTAVWMVVLLSSVFSVFAGTVVLRHSHDLAPRAAPVLVALSLMAVSSAWVLTHTAYTLRYAHLYYRDDGDGIGGLEFPGKQPPTDVDFAYFAFTIGMCFQVSDVTVTSRIIRRDVLVHAVISFAYNTAILALALNLAFGLLG